MPNTENAQKILQARIDRDTLSLQRDTARLASHPAELALAKSDYEAKLAQLEEDEEKLNADIAFRTAEIAKTQEELKSL